MLRDSRSANTSRAEEIVRYRLASVFALFDQPDVTEVSIIGGGNIWATRSGMREPVALKLEEPDLVGTLNALASSMGQSATPETADAVVHSKFPGYRFSGVLAPTSAKGTSINIRKHSPRVFTLDDYVRLGSMPTHVAEFLAESVRRGDNMLAAGSTDTGKTTLLNALSREIPSDKAVLTIEDTLELNLVVPNWRQLEANAPKGLTVTKLVEYAMRASPDRIVVGELRGVEAAAFLEAANTGHEGCMASLHCNSAYDALSRLEILVLRADLGWPLPAIRQQIASTIKTVVHMARVNGRRVLNEVAVIKGNSPDTGHYEVDFVYQRQHQQSSPLERNHQP